MAKYVMALDAGTTSNRCILFNEKGEICSMAQKEFTQYFPKPGWVEHDPREIWSTQLSVARQAMNQINASAADIAAIGITNQRETAIVWHKNTGKPVYQCMQTLARGRTLPSFRKCLMRGLNNPRNIITATLTVMNMISGVTIIRNMVKLPAL